MVVSALTFAQTYVNEEKTIIDHTSQRSSNEQLNIVQSKSSFNPITNLPALGNSVFIQQVGFGNIGFIAVASDQSEINLSQTGINNEASIILNASIIRENVVQIGNDNIFKDYSVHGAQLHTADVLQEGNYNEIIRTGSNSISERIKITQTGIGKTAYIIHN
jgi:hypothetical protein